MHAYNYLGTAELKYIPSSGSSTTSVSKSSLLPLKVTRAIVDSVAVLPEITNLNRGGYILFSVMYSRSIPWSCSFQKSTFDDKIYQ